MSNQKADRDLDDHLLAQMRQDFLEEAGEHLDQLNLKLIQLEGDGQEEGVIDETFRIVHTLKGSSAFVGLKEMSELSRQMEEVFGNLRKGSFSMNAGIIGIMYEALDVLTTLADRAKNNEAPEMDISGILRKLEAIPEGTVSGFEGLFDKQEAKPELESTDSEAQELVRIYKDSYDQLAVLKHIVYSSVHLSDPESLAVLFSKQIDERMSAHRNAIWLVVDDHEAVEIARNGQLVKEDPPRVLDIASSEALRRVIRDQLVIWPSNYPQAKEALPEFQSPTLFPIKAEPQALGFLVVDPEETAEVEVYQFVGQFAAMILNISKLHHQVEEQRKELNDLTEVLFKQNAQLASLYHAELDMMKTTDPVQLCSIVVEAVVSGLEARRAAAFLIDESSEELVGTSESGGLEGIDGLRFPVGEKEAIRESIASGRMVTRKDDTEKLHLGSNVLENWLVVCFKGRERAQGVLVAEIENKDTSDSISILVNHAAILLDNLVLQKRLGSAVTDG